MKILLYLILFSTSLSVFSQPGDIIGWQIGRITEINSLLKVDTNNPQLLWDRLEIVFNPHFNIYAQTRMPISKPDKMILGEERMLSKAFNTVNVLNDINFLIENNASVKAKYNNRKMVTLSDFHYKRGQYYYNNGKPKEALEDYLVALHSEPDTYLLNRISISIAAYYYNLDTIFNLSNLEKALESIDLAIPKEIENNPETFDRFTDRNHHPFEREKIMLLELTKKDIRLRNYLKSLAKSHLNLYNTQIKKSEEFQKSHSYTIPKTLETGLDYLYQIADNYYKESEFEKSKKIMGIITNYIPNGQVRYLSYDKYYLLLDNIFEKSSYKDTSLEITNILNIAGYPKIPLKGRSIKSMINQIDKHIKAQPENPKLFLAKAILLYKENELIPNPTTIVNLSDSSQNLGLVDYRIPYLKGLVFKHQIKYKEAITEYDKAIAIFENDPFLYRAKLEILQKIPNYDEAKMKATRNKIKSLPIPTSSNITTLIQLIDEL